MKHQQLATRNQQLPTIFPNRDSLIFEDILQGICGLLKNGLFSLFYCSFGVFLGYERAHSCAPVRKMSKKRRKTKKNEEK
jgi:hypothetical protein